MEITTVYQMTPLGPFRISGSDLGIREVKLVEETDFEDVRPAKEVKKAAFQLREYFDKRRQQFDLKLDWSGAPEFHQRVWQELLQIPFGHTTSYLSIAERLGDPKSVRAVGQANRNNPIAIIVPCHRVIAKSGDLQGYFYGLDVKRKLLELENPMAFGLQTTLF